MRRWFEKRQGRRKRKATEPLDNPPHNKQTKKDVLGRDNMWEPKLPLALSSERSNFGSHMLLLPRTDFYFFSVVWWVKREKKKNKPPYTKVVTLTPQNSQQPEKNKKGRTSLG